MPSRDCVLERSMSAASGARAGARDAHIAAQSVRRQAPARPTWPEAQSRREVRQQTLSSPQTPTKTLVGRRCRLTEAPYPLHDGGG